MRGGGRPTHPLAGRSFGRLTVLGLTERPAMARTAGSYWLCRCDGPQRRDMCAGSAVVVASSLTRGNTRSCGCLRRETAVATAKRKSLARCNSGV